MLIERVAKCDKTGQRNTSYCLAPLSTPISANRPRELIFGRSLSEWLRLAATLLCLDSFSTF